MRDQRQRTQARRGVPPRAPSYTFMSEQPELEPSHYEVSVELARKGLRDKITAEEVLMKTGHQSDAAGHSAHFEERNLLMEALDGFEEVAARAQGNHDLLHSLIQERIDGCVDQITQHNEPDENAPVSDMADMEHLQWMNQLSKLERELKIWETIRDEAFPQG